jgi:hypothetical protein
MRDEKTGFRFNRNIAGYLKLTSAFPTCVFAFALAFVAEPGARLNPYYACTGGFDL